MVTPSLFTFRLMPDGRVRLARRKEDQPTEDLIDDETEVEAISFEAVLNNDDTWDTPRPDRVSISLRRYHIEAAECAFHMGMEVDLTFEDVGRLHAFLELLLRSGPLGEVT